ncbi:Tn3 family transposase TnXax1 [Commensalibacter sp. Nvir]|uniref:lytic murein transglycosylase n=1 Tax=Commensalibacter sp. Nvir TaxID=3069817 RepID=UPI002D546B8D|nr:Tn3 family transposase TnXax1 [Commensalibacter sp. Nvir]
MQNRRQFLTQAGIALTSLAVMQMFSQATQAFPPLSYKNFLQEIYQQASQKGMNAQRIQPALFALNAPNEKVLQLDRKQPEFTLTWEEYYQKVVTASKIEKGKKAFSDTQAFLTLLWQQYSVDPRVVLSIWGIESAYGEHNGNFNVIDSLATLAYEGRRANFFKSELFNALKIIDNGDITWQSMLGSYAGAMGQPQFMPSAYLRYAVDATGDGRRDIWNNIQDVLASIANYLNKFGWRANEPWGQEITLPVGFSDSMIGRHIVKPLQYWSSLGVRRKDSSNFASVNVGGAILCPDGVGGKAYMVYHNFNVIRRYNPSDYYALAVGLLSNNLT